MEITICAICFVGGLLFGILVGAKTVERKDNVGTIFISTEDTTLNLRFVVESTNVDELIKHKNAKFKIKKDSQ